MKESEVMKMGDMLLFPRALALDDDLPADEFLLRSLLVVMGVDQLDRNGSLRCRFCGEVWQGQPSDGESESTEGWWLCPNQCNS